MLTPLSCMFELSPLPPTGILDVRFFQENTNGLESLFIPEDAAAERDILLSVPYDEQLVVKWDKNITPGSYSVKWDGTDNYGKNVSSGVYIYIIRTDTGFIQSRRLLLIR